VVDAGLAHTSDTLLFLAVLAYVVAMLGYAAEFAFGRLGSVPPAVAGGAVDTLPADYVTRVARRTRDRGWPVVVGQVAVGLTSAGWALHNGSVVTRGQAAHRVPWGNMYEFSSMVCLVAVTAFLYVLTRRSNLRYLGAFVMLPVVLYLGLAGTVLYVPAQPLMPALNSYWIKIHVVGAMTSSGVFMLGFVLTLLYLVKSRFPGARLPAAATLDRVAYRVNAFAFPIWTFAVIAGAIWAEAAWGRYWGWDPKETWSFVTWVIYAGYLHSRATPGWRGRRAAWIAIAGFVSLMITYYAVNLWISGLHSYAGV
jgi:cytochrome c-type biogenesis protein CcsB